MKVIIKNARLAFPALFEPSAFAGDSSSKPSYSATFIISPLDDQVELVERAIEQAAKEKWGPKAEAILRQLKAQDKVFLHDGELKASYAGFAGNLYINARSVQRPIVIDRNKAPLTERDGRPYAGCYVNASIDIYAQDNQYGKRINAMLLGVQFAKDGEAFSGGALASPDDFEEIVEDEAVDFL